MRAPAESSHKGCCDTFCQHACHLMALAEDLPVASAMTPGAQAVTEVPSPGLPLVFHPLDHVPLA